MCEKDFNVKITVRNARLLSAIRESYPSEAAFSRAINASPTAVNAIVCMRQKPVTASGEWRELARDMAAALNKYPDEIWPEHLRDLQAAKSTAEIEMNIDDLPRLQSGSMAEARRLIAKWSDNLSDRASIVLSMRAEGATLDEVAVHLGVTKGRVRQIEVKAMRDMRRFASRDGVRSVLDIDGLEGKALP